MSNLEKLYAAYMDGGEPTILDRANLPRVDWDTTLKWPRSEVEKMGRANTDLEMGKLLTTARIIGKTSILGSDEERMIQFWTSTNGEYFIHIRRGKMAGQVALQSSGISKDHAAARPFLRIDRESLAVYFRGKATPPRAASRRAVIYDQLQVGGYTCLVEPAGKGHANDIYRKPNKIETMQVVSDIPEWCTDLVPWHIQASLPRPDVSRDGSQQVGGAEDTAAHRFVQ